MQVLDEETTLAHDDSCAVRHVTVLNVYIINSKQQVCVLTTQWQFPLLQLQSSVMSHTHGDICRLLLVLYVSYRC